MNHLRWSVHFIRPKKRTIWTNEATDYAADMNPILAYYNLIDDWKDDKSYPKKAFAKNAEKIINVS